MHKVFAFPNTLCTFQNFYFDFNTKYSFFQILCELFKIPITKAAVNHKKIAYTATFETLKFLYFRKLGKELGEKLGKTKPTSSPSGKHMGLYTISIWYLTSPFPNQLQSTTPFTTPFRCEITPIYDKLRYSWLFTNNPQALENTGFFGILGRLEIKQA